METVLIAAGLTAAITVSLTIYACTTKTDFTYCGGLLFMLACVVFVGGIFTFFFRNSTARIVLCAICVILYGLYLIYDTQLVVGGGRCELSIDDYVVGALILYVDIIQLFLKILELLGKK
jgi:FtsH-binding integral membrane protein